MWRIVDAQEKMAPFSSVSEKPFHSFARFSRLARRLMHGERAEARLFFAIAAFSKFLMDNNLPEESLRDLEIVMGVKTLHELGYGGEGKEAEFVSKEPLSFGLLEFVKENRRVLASFVNTRLRESHL